MTILSEQQTMIQDTAQFLRTRAADRIFGMKTPQTRNGYARLNPTAIKRA